MSTDAIRKFFDQCRGDKADPELAAAENAFAALEAENKQLRETWDRMLKGDSTTEEEKGIFRSIFGPTNDELRIVALEQQIAAMNKLCALQMLTLFNVKQLSDMDMFVSPNGTLVGRLAQIHEQAVVAIEDHQQAALTPPTGKGKSCTLQDVCGYGRKATAPSDEGSVQLWSPGPPPTGKTDADGNLTAPNGTISGWTISEATPPTGKVPTDWERYIALGKAASRACDVMSEVLEHALSRDDGHWAEMKAAKEGILAELLKEEHDQERDPGVE